MTIGYCLANNLLRVAKSINRGRVDDIDALLDRGADGGDRISASSVPPHIHPPMAQVPMATRDILSDVPKISASSMFIL